MVVLTVLLRETFPSLLQQDLRFHATTPTLDPAPLPAVANSLFCEQFHQFIVKTINSTLRAPMLVT
ncbi:UNVERIFIED_CONTAM: hypothetical protein Sradi_3771600 [Sesamum radiatum]|uniref:Uncharacterized protein n=1 Tax=Sesamum radiatum TaxID=300843 RepID=A0AAW2PZS7_SESRA